MQEELHYRHMNPGEEEEVCGLVSRVFNRFVAPDFGPEGVREFFDFASPKAVAERCASGGFVLVAVERQTIVGIIEVHEHKHVALLFVENGGRGIAGELLRRAVSECRESRPDLERITVHSSLYAEPIYRKLGFRPTGRKRTKHGITYVPMSLELSGSRTDRSRGSAGSVGSQKRGDSDEDGVEP